MEQSSEEQKGRTRVMVLLSGGIDSAACLAFYARRGCALDSLFVDYGHAAAHEERAAAERLSKYYDSRYHEACLSGLPAKNTGYVAGRNGLLFTIALGIFPVSAGLIALGIHSGTGYPDCGRQFIGICRELASLYTGGRVEPAAPFADWDKGGVLRCAETLGVPIEQTYSCEAGTRDPCGRCLSCRDRDVYP